MFTPVCSQLYDWILYCPRLNINGWGFLQTHAALLSKTKGAQFIYLILFRILV